MVDRPCRRRTRWNPPDPFVIAPTGLTRLDASALRSLKSLLDRLGPPDRTIRLHSWGLDHALKGSTDEGEQLRWEENQHLWHQERMERLGGFICYSAPPVILRQQALRIHRLKVKKGNEFREMDYHFLAEESCRDSWFGDGEVQIFADYMERVAAAVEARNELLANPNQAIISETVQEAISRWRDRIKARRARKRSQLA